MHLVSVFLFWDGGGVYWHGESVFIGMQEVRLLAWRRCIYWDRGVCLLAWRRCVYWNGGGAFIGMEVCLLAWRRCVYWRGGGVFLGMEEVCYLNGGGVFIWRG